MCRRSNRVCVHHLNFQYNNFYICLFYCQKMAFVCEFHTPLQKMIFFSMFHTSCGYEILGTCTQLT
jgi:hypothetical protein